MNPAHSYMRKHKERMGGVKRCPTKVIFVDRDGVINKDPGGWTEYDYVTNPGDFQFIPGSLEALRLLKNNHLRVIVISNQAGVGKGYFSARQLEAVNNKMIAEVKSGGGEIAEAYYCIHKEEDNCPCRKPKTGLLEMAVKKYGVDPRDAYFVGDSYVDMTAGKMIGTKTIFVLSGKYSTEEMKKWAHKPDYIFANLLEAVQWILGKERRKSRRAMKRGTQ